MDNKKTLTLNKTGIKINIPQHKSNFKTYHQDTNNDIKSLFKNTNISPNNIPQNKEIKQLDKKIEPIKKVESNTIKENPTILADNNSVTKTPPKSIHQLLAQENRKRKEEEENRKREEIARKENRRKQEQEEKLRRFNSKINRDRNPDRDTSKEQETSTDNSNNSTTDNRNHNRFGHNDRFKRREGSDNGGGNYNRNGYNKDFRRDGFKKDGFRTNNSNNGDVKKGGNNFNKDNRFPRNNSKFIIAQPIMETNINTNKGKKDYNKKTYKDDDKDEGSRSRKKIVYIASDDDNNGRTRRKAGYFKSKDKTEQQPKEKIIQDIALPEFITVGDLADKMNEKRADVVKKLISMGMVVTINQTLDADTAELLVAEFGHNIKKRTTEHDAVDKLSEEQGTNFVSRAPVVTIMGHVDHGKTSLLDAIRTTKVAEGESGGITQHIGASRVEVGNGKFITFIDTPGHEAFTEMRMRGANITDIVVLVVAADDGVKEQTIEAINHAKLAKVPIILAINKIDKQGANPSRVKQELLQYDIVTEEFGGDVMAVEVSAKEKIGLDKLRETILLQAEVMDLKAPIDVKPIGAIIESRMEQNKGVVASLLVQKGILREGDLVLAGTSYGRIKKMTDDKGKTQKEAYPSEAVEILGFDVVPSAGDVFNVVATDKEARDIIAYRSRKDLENKVAKRNVKSLDSMLKVVGGKSAKLLPVIIKADVNGSIEAIIGTLTKLNTSEVEIDVIHSTTGAINESDINLATISNAIIIGFNVRATAKITESAKKNGIDIRYYSIIYNIVDDMKNILSGLLDPTIREEITGHAEIRQVFKITGVGNIAGCFVIDGEISRNNEIRLIRDNVVIYTGKIGALKRFKDDVKEVKKDFECGISIENYNDMKEKDVIEGFRVVEEKRSL